MSTYHCKISDNDASREVYRPCEFAISTRKDPNLAAKLSEFLSVMFCDGLDPEYSGYFEACIAEHPYEGVPKDRHPAAEKTPGEVGDGEKCAAPKRSAFKGMESRKVTELPQAVSGLSFYRHDYYITKNRFKAPFKRNTDSLFGLSSIVVDIDCHRNIFGKDNRCCLLKAVNELACQLPFMLSEYSDIPMPNAVAYTGRGLQLWWKLAPCAFKGYKKMYRAVAGYYADTVAKFLNGCGRFSGFSVDRPASVNPAGVARIPGTYNEKACAYGGFYMLHGDSVDLYEAAGRLMEDAGKGRKRMHSYYRPENAAEYATRREGQLASLLAIRKHEGVTETRDEYLIIVFSSWLSATGDERLAMDRMLNFNGRFEVPMPEEEAESYMSSSIRRGGYRYSNARIIEALGISQSEQEAIGLRPTSGKRASERRAPLPEEKVAELCKNGVRTETEIAGMTGCSRQSVHRILKKNGLRTEKKKTHDKALAAARRGTCAKTIFIHCGGALSLSAIYKIISAAREWRRRADEKLAGLKRKKAAQSAIRTAFSPDGGGIQVPTVRTGFAEAADAGSTA